MKFSEPVMIKQHNIELLHRNEVGDGETLMILDNGCDDIDSTLGFVVMMRLHIPFYDIAFLFKLHRHL